MATTERCNNQTEAKAQQTKFTTLRRRDYRTLLGPHRTIVECVSKMSYASALASKAVEQNDGESSFLGIVEIFSRSHWKMSQGL